MNRKITKTPILKLLNLLVALFLFVSTALSQEYEQQIREFREDYKNEFLKDSHSPLKKEDIDYLRFFEPDESYRVKCTFRPVSRSEPFELPTSSGQTQTYVVFGQLTFKILGKKQKLHVYRSLALMRNPIYEDYLFIPFKDLTNGTETYGGGRYLDLRMKELEDNDLWLDFNKAYNPYCAFAAGYSCPVPPKENHLKVKIEAGEMNFAKEIAH